MNINLTDSRATVRSDEDRSSCIINLVVAEDPMRGATSTRNRRACGIWRQTRKSFRALAHASSAFEA